MTYYTIDIKDCSLTPDVDSTQDFFNLRRANLKITSVLWLTTGVEIDPLYDDCTYTKHVPVLIFLN